MTALLKLTKGVFWESAFDCKTAIRRSYPARRIDGAVQVELPIDDARDRLDIALHLEVGAGRAAADE